MPDEWSLDDEWTKFAYELGKDRHDQWQQAAWQFANWGPLLVLLLVLATILF